MIDKEKIKEKIRADNFMKNRSDDFVDRWTELTIQNCIPELEQNLMEWAEDKPYSDIVIGNGWTVNKILEIYPWVGFQEILLAMKIYKENNFENDMFTILFHRYYS